MIEAYPLQWPIGYKRTTSRQTSRFEQSAEKAQLFLRKEIERLGGRNLIVSSNVMVRNDGLLYSDMSGAKLPDPGVAIYFKYKGNDVVMCCDQYSRPWENVYALGKGIEALRGMERWGVSEFMDRAFTGFKALPETTGGIAISWWNILEVPADADEYSIKSAYQRLAKKYHPDNQETGNGEKFIQVKSAYDQAIRNS